MERWCKSWSSYEDLKWPWRWRIIGQVTRRWPGKWAAWQINRELARQGWGSLRMIWAEPYLCFWVIINGWFEIDGVQWGFCEIVRKPKTKEQAQEMARTYLETWKAEALRSIRVAFRAKHDVTR